MCCDSWGHKESDTTEQLNQTELIHRSFVSLGRYIPKYFIFFIAMVNGASALFKKISFHSYKIQQRLITQLVMCKDENPAENNLLFGRQCHPVVAHVFIHQYMTSESK